MKIGVETNASSRGLSFGPTIGQMKTKPTITDMAAHLEVHPSTISLALRDSPKVSLPVKERILKLAKEWGYVPNQMARSLQSKRTKLIGLIFPYAAIPHYGMLLDRLCWRIEKSGYRSEVLFHEWSEDREKAALRTLVEQRAEGVLLNPSVPNSEPMLQEVLPPNWKLPAVILGRPARLEGSQAMRGYVATNALVGARVLARHLLSRGHRCAALLLGEAPIGRSTTAMRAAGMRNEFRRHANTSLHLVSLEDEALPDGGGQAIREHGSSVGDSIRLSKALADRIFSLRPLPTAVVTADEITAHILLSILTARGLSVPKDISIACFGGTLFASYGAVPLTSVDHPYDEIAQVALDLLLASSAPAQPRVELLAPLFVDRGSVQIISQPIQKVSDGRNLSEPAQNTFPPTPTPDPKKTAVSNQTAA